tara:strand:- start:1611 stop:2285 length:675 start_codon:yes stop_codon:yes gene_type:complete
MANEKVYFQIGTNSGDDGFRKKCLKDKPTKIILVEPNPEMRPFIEKNYKDIENVFIYINAIYYKTGEDVELIMPSRKGVVVGEGIHAKGKRAENGMVYSNRHYSLIPMNDWGKREDWAILKAKGISFDDICKEHNITHISYLQMDTEGFDSEIIKMIDLNKYKINVVRYERWAFEPTCYTKHHNDIIDNVGKNGMKNSMDKFIKHNYTMSISEDKRDHVATLIE